MENDQNIRFLKLLAKQYPNIQAASSEIINLNAILNLPKGTEHFISDLHGEYEAFNHMLKNASGVIKKKIDEHFGTTLTERERKTFATLIYYPREKLSIIKNQVENLEDWYKITLYRLVDLCNIIASKYTRSKVRKALPKDFEYIIEELLHGHNYLLDKNEYYAEIIGSIIKTGRADAFIVSLANLIQRLAIDRLHIIGDIFDRGPSPDKILDKLMGYHSLDIQWGNHDVLWMGAASGNQACIANAIRISTRYGTLDTIEDAYGISIRPLVTFALETYRDDEKCRSYLPIELEGDSNTHTDRELLAKIHKAITVIQLKLEGQLIKAHPEYKMDDRLLLDQICYEDYTIELGGKKHSLTDTYLPTVDPKDPCKLTQKEQEVIQRLTTAFKHSEKLQAHVRFLYAAGSMYTIFNGNLLYHGCIPLDKDGRFACVEFDGKCLSGKAWLDYCDKLARQGYFAEHDLHKKRKGCDFLWYLWCGVLSPLFGKSKMATFESYFLEDKSLAVETKNAYYTYIDEPETAQAILKDFGCDPNESHIVNGHVPVRCKYGENPIKAGGKLFIIDGGLSKAYQSKTGNAGYTLIFNSYGLLLVSHEPFQSTINAIVNEQDIHSSTMVLEKKQMRIKVADTDIGKNIKSQIADLEMLLAAYRDGVISQENS